MNDLFPLVACQRCQGERLAFIELVADELVPVCAYCGTPGVISRQVDDSVLSAHGLRIKTAPAIEPALPKTKGCSKAGSCGKAGGCGSSAGGCGSCSSGSCGTKSQAA